MNIQKASVMAKMINGYIWREDMGKVFIKPTSSVDGCIVMINKDDFKRRWQPTLDDLISNDWKVFNESDFLLLSTS